MKDIFYKIIIILFLLGAAFLGYKYYETDKLLKKEQASKLSEINELKAKYEKQKDSLVLIEKELLIEFKKDLESLSKVSEKLTKKIKDYEKNPDYSLDFIASYGIISNSSYRRE